MSRSGLHIGFEKGSGEEVSIPVFHTLTLGITRHGKSVTMKSLAERANEQGYTILVFDVKTPRDYAEVGTDIRPYIDEHTDPLMLKNLIEGSMDVSTSFAFSELVQVAEDGGSYQEILDDINEWMDDDTHPITENKLYVLRYLLRKIVEDMRDVDVVEEFELERGEINVMDLHEFDKDVQQLAVRSSLEEVRKYHEDVIVVIDEAQRFAPQSAKSAAKEEITDTIREGGAKEVWVWLSNQTYTGVEKKPLKQAGGAWIMGRQVEKNEAGHIVASIPGKGGYGKNDIMSLEVGHFIVSHENKVREVYVQPYWLDTETAKAIATGEIDMDDIRETSKEDVEELEEALQERETEVQGLREKLQERDQRIEELESKVENLESADDDDLETQVAEPEAAKATPEIDLEEVEELMDEKLEELLSEVEVPEGITVRKEVPSIEVRREVERIEVTDDDLKGKLALLYAEQDLPDGWFTTGDVYSAMDARGWSQDPRTSNVLKEFCEYGFLRKSGGKYKVQLPPKEAQDRGLLVVEEVMG